ncbi:MAG TPA: chemotaxis protein CheW [Fibrobacteria bacterium]|nr:chemotaxis protein CheW [Fibrobacteria bacterium]
MSSAVQILIFRAGSRRCALPVSDLLEILRPLPVEPIAHAPACLLGIAIIRGFPVPVVDLGILLGDPEEEAPAGAASRFVSLRMQGRRTALAVDEVIGLRELDASSLEGLPALLRDASEGPVASLGALDSGLLLLLRAARLLPHDAQEALAVPRI